MNLFAGTGSPIRLALRRDRIRLAIWVLLLATLPVITAASFAELYPEAAAREQIAATLGSSPAIGVLLGPLYDSSIGGLTAWRLAVPAKPPDRPDGLVHGGAAHAGRGRSGPQRPSWCQRRRSACSARRGTGGGDRCQRRCGCALHRRSACRRSTGPRVRGFRLGDGGLRSRLRCRRRSRRSALAGFIGRSRSRGRGARNQLHVARRRRQHFGVEWLSWISPLGWSQRLRAFGDERWWVLAIPLIVGMILVATAFVLSTTADPGAGILATKPGPEAAAATLRSPLALSWRLHGGTLIGWIVGFVGLGSVMGTSATTFADLFAESRELAQLVAQLVARKGWRMRTSRRCSGSFHRRLGIREPGRPPPPHRGVGGPRFSHLATAVARWRWEGSHLCSPCLDLRCYCW